MVGEGNLSHFQKYQGNKNVLFSTFEMKVDAARGGVVDAVFHGLSLVAFAFRKPSVFT